MDIRLTFAVSIIVSLLTVNRAANTLSRHWTCQPEFEKILHLEGEMIDFCRTVIDGERLLHAGRDRHNFTDVTSFLPLAERHHEKNMQREHDIIENPLSLFKVKMWLQAKWPQILEHMTQSDLVHKHAELSHLLGEFQAAVSSIDMVAVVGEILGLMKIYDLPVNSVAMGTFGPAQIEALSSGEIFQIVESTNDLEDHEMALRWLRTALDTNSDDMRMVHYQNLLGSTYIKMRRYEEAKEIYVKLLERDQSNRSAKSNLRLIEQRRQSRATSSGPRRQEDDRIDLLNKYCHHGVGMPVDKKEKLKCFTRIIKASNETLNVEELHRHPQVVMIHDILNDDQGRHLVTRAADTLWDTLNSAFRELQPNTKGTELQFTSTDVWMDTYLLRLRNVTYNDTPISPEHNATLSGLTVHNHGAGMRENLITEEEFRMLTLRHEQKVAHYHIFLNEPEHGGEMVFPDLKLLIKPVRNAGVFWQFRSPGGAVHRGLRKRINCPVLIGTQWNAAATLEHKKLFKRIRF